MVLDLWHIHSRDEIPAMRARDCILLPFAADWRWLEKRSESPWYPTLCLFRQPRAGDWQSVLESVAGTLAETLNCRRVLESADSRAPALIH